MRGLVCLLVVVCAGGVWAQGGAAVAEDVVEVETFTPPVFVRGGKLKYPRKNFLRRKEGWVTMSFMVDPEGVPYDVTVVNSSGDPAFEKAAIKGAQKRRYEPAKLNGVAIDAGTAIKIRFAVSESGGATLPFRKLYRRAMQHIREDNQEQADLVIDELSRIDRNLYEEAYYNFAKYAYYLEWGSDLQRYTALRRAAFVDAGKEFLPSKALTTAMHAKLVLEVQLSLMGKALKTAEALLERKLDDERRNRIIGLLERIKTLKRSDQSFAVEGVVGESNRFTHLLLKSDFYFENIEGDIAELRLHCDKDYVGFIYDDDIKYKVDKGLANCWLTVIGTPDTTFRLVET